MPFSAFHVVSARAQMQVVPGILTVAGSGLSGDSGDNSAATSAQLSGTSGIVFDAAGNFYESDYDNGRVRKINITTGVISTYAGNGTQGYDGDGGPATSAKLYHPISLAMDGAGNLYIADADNERVRKVSASTGFITTVAGNGTAGDTGDGGAAINAEINTPCGVAVDSAGNLYIADLRNHVVRKVTASTGYISVLAGTGISGNAGDGGSATSALLNAPFGLTFDAARTDLFISDLSNNNIREVSLSTGIISLVAGTGTAGSIGDTGQATLAELNQPRTVALDFSGNLYIPEFSGNRIRVVNAVTGIISTVAGTGIGGYNGDGIPAQSAEFSGPAAVALDSSGNLYIADNHNDRIRKVMLNTAFSVTALGSSVLEKLLIQTTAAETISSITAAQSQGSFQEFTVGTVSGCTTDGSTSNSSGTICTVPVTFSPAYPGQRNVPLTAVTSTGNAVFGLSGTGTGPLAAFTPGTIMTVAGNGTAGETGNAGPSTSAQLDVPIQVAVDSSGNIYIADYSGETVRKVTASTGNISVIAGTGTPGYSGDGGGATSANLSGPDGLGIDSAGNIYISDLSNCRVRMVTIATGIISTVAGNGTCGYNGDGALATNAELNYNIGNIAFDSQGNWYFADYVNSRVRKVTLSTGIITTIAGNGTAGFSGDNGPATVAELNYPQNMVVDTAGNVYISDTFNNRIRVVTAATGVITTVAGDGMAAYYGDGVPATSAELSSPSGVAIDAAGDIYIADNDNNRVRVVAASNGIITTIAGNGTAGYEGDGGPATVANLNSPASVAVDSAGNVFIADLSNSRVRKVTVNQSALSFATATPVGETNGTEAPLTLSNIGNSALTLSVPSNGSNPSVAANFFFDASTTCPQLYIDSPPATLASGATCIYALDFQPVSEGNISGSMIVTDNSLGQVGAVQTVTLSGTSTADATSTAVTFSANPASVFSPVTFTATVTDTSAGALTPTGTVQFSVDGTNVGGVVTLSSGTATYTTSALAPGTHSIAARYNSNSTSFVESTSPSFSQTITKATPTISWATPATIVYGTALSSVQLNASSTVIGTFVYTPAAGTVPSTGSQSLLVTFTPIDSTDYNTATQTVSLTVTKAMPIITWSAPTAIAYGAAPFTVSATSTSSGVFTYSAVGGPATISGATVTLTGTGTVILEAAQTADSNYNAGTKDVSFTVSPAVTTLALQASSTTLTYGQQLTLTATLSPYQVGTTNTAGETITFKDGGTTLGTGTLFSGTATFTLSSLTAGSHTLTAAFAGDSSYASAISSSFIVAVARTPAIVTVSGAPNPSNFGDLVVFTVTISGIGVVPTGMATIMDGAVALTTLALDGNGSATYTTRTLGAGTHSLRAVYDGDSDYD